MRIPLLTAGCYRHVPDTEISNADDMRAALAAERLLDASESDDDAEETPRRNRRTRKESNQ